MLSSASSRDTRPLGSLHDHVEDHPMSLMFDCQARFGYAEEETLSLVSAADAKKKAPSPSQLQSKPFRLRGHCQEARLTSDVLASLFPSSRWISPIVCKDTVFGEQTRGSPMPFVSEEADSSLATRCCCLHEMPASQQAYDLRHMIDGKVHQKQLKRNVQVHGSIRSIGKPISVHG